MSGDLSCGKTTLIAKLQGNEEPEKGSGLEFTHLTVSDDYREGMCIQYACCWRRSSYYILLVLPLLPL